MTLNGIDDSQKFASSIINAFSFGLNIDMGHIVYYTGINHEVKNMYLAKQKKRSGEKIKIYFRNYKNFNNLSNNRTLNNL
jgi:hypothetical protein